MRAGSATFTPKGYTPLGEAITRIGRSLSDEWTGEEFAPALASMVKINRDAQTHFIGWVADHCVNAENTGTHRTRRTVENPDGGRPLSTLATEQWDRASEIYEEARSLIDEMAQFESIKAGGGHLAKIWNDPERGIVWEWPEDFPLSKDDLKALKVEEEEFRAPREAAYKRLDEAARLLQQELCGTPPNCEDAIPALWCLPGKMPVRIKPESWLQAAGLNRIKAHARADYKAPGSSRVIVSQADIDRLVRPLKSPADERQPNLGRRPQAVSKQDQIHQQFNTIVEAKNLKFRHGELTTIARKIAGDVGYKTDSVRREISPSYRELEKKNQSG